MAPPKIKDVHLKLQTGHGAGQTSVAYANTPKEISLVTSGADGRVYLRDALILEPQGSCKVDTPPATILAVDPKGKYVAVGDDSYVKLYKLPSLTPERSACRFNLTLRALSFSPCGTKLAAAGDDNLIKLVEVKDGSVYRTLNSDDYVLSLAWDPDSTYLAATLRTGGLVVYDTGSGKLEKRVDAQCERVDYSSLRRHAPSWHPDGGSVLAVPVGAEGDVALHERLSWEATGYLSGEHRKAVNIVAFSPNGVYAATAGQDKRIVVWDVNSVTAVAAATADEVMSGLVWRPDGNELAMVGESGGVGVWSGVVPKEMPGPAVSAAELERLQREQERLADLRKRGKEAEREAAGLGADLVPPEGGEIREEVIEEMEVEAAAAAAGAAGAGEEGAKAAVADGGEGEGEDGLEGGSGRGGSGGLGHSGVNGRPATRTQTTTRTIVRTVVAPPAGPAPQPAFQPGATAAEPGRPRFLCYNMVGSVSSRPVDDHHVVEVLFHDSSRFSSRVPLLTDYYGFDKAALGDKGVVYASPAVKADPAEVAAAAAEGAPPPAGVPALVMFRPFDPWAPNSDWTATLAEGEEALCLATGSTFVAVATSRQLLRLFTLGGAQQAVLRLEGQPVALVAAGGQLAVAWHSGPPNPHTKSQALSLSLYDTLALVCVFSQPLPLSPGATLTWLGFSEDTGVPAAADSSGVVCVRTPDFGGRWVPVFEPPAARRASEVLWPVGLSSEQLYAIVCKPAEPRPQVSPRPFYTPMDLCPPVLALDGGAGAAAEWEAKALLEAVKLSVLRARLEAAEMSGQVEEASDLRHLKNQGEAKHDAALLKAFQKFVRAERHGRALEVAAMLNMCKSLSGAVAVANHHQARGLAERIAVVLEQKQAIIAANEAMAAGVDAYAHQHQHQQHHQAAAAEQHHHVAAGEHQAAPAGRSYTPIPFARRGGGVESAASELGQGGEGAAAAGRGTQPLGPADLNAGAADGAGGADRGGLTPFADVVTAPGSTGLSTGPKSGRGLPTPNTLLQAATAKPDPGSDSHKRKQPTAFNNPFARKAAKLGK
ncbi:hypothetical protein HYH02_003663 [Chlamydomonas schloesseri]|uniref:Minichromosome loss protein Mcl1 middle region domain-containing protein n=1 Tax=Chlamydomonas schloesseri TaxID=2026947 RepID=A0A835WPW1_9CHLO|nr:hypothetical protein HYH02_003663 [Chlamydomonas schloesseri]|eukprot:KAG2451888.1 hypothetical protein HYH02_003663 [Chlamydomonas schloesseri]